MSRPDVAILLDSFGPGGVERVACHVANGLAARGFRVEMVVNRDSGPVRSLLDEAIPVVALGGSAFLPRGLRLLLSAPRLARYLARRDPRVLHSPGNHLHLASVTALTLTTRCPIYLPKLTNPIIKQAHGSFRSILRRRFYAHVLGRAAAIIVLAPSALAQIRACGKDLVDRVRTLHNPYVRLAASDHRGEPPQPPVILTVGRLNRQKDHVTLLQAVSLLNDRQWLLRIVGSGPEETALREEAVRLGIGARVQFTGFLKDVALEYDRATVFALSSRWEELPAALIEAMSRGCPVVSTASSHAVVELLNELGARQPTPVGDVEALALSLRAALDGEMPAIRDEKLAPYDIESACDEHAALIAQLIAR